MMWSKISLDALNEAAKEISRLVLIAVIPVLIDSLNKGYIDYRAVLVIAVIAGLRGVEKFLYENESKNPVTNFLKLE